MSTLPTAFRCQLVPAVKGPPEFLQVIRVANYFLLLREAVDVDATIKAIINTTGGVKYQIDFDVQRRALISEWQIMKDRTS